MTLKVEVLKNCLYFDGVDDYVLISTRLFSYPMTICLWVKPLDDVRRHYVYASKSGWDGWGPENETHVSQIDGYFSFFCQTKNVTHVDRRRVAPVSSNWRFISVVLDSTYKFYLNGFLADSATIVGTPDFSTYDAITYIGRPVLSIRFMYGMASNVRIYDRALSENEIRILYNGGDVRDGLVLYLPMDEGSGSTVYDHSGYNNHGTIYGATWSQVWWDVTGRVTSLRRKISSRQLETLECEVIYHG